MPASSVTPVATGEPSTTREDFVVRRVLARLGAPDNLFRVHARNVWGNHYRVNVFCTIETGLSLPAVQITDSFFVTVTEDDIVSEPVIQRKYDDQLHLAV